jgi:hypothetical protein
MGTESTIDMTRQANSAQVRLGANDALNMTTNNLVAGRRTQAAAASSFAGRILVVADAA